MRLTAKVAETIVDTLKEKGVEVDSFYVKDLDKATVKNYDCVIAGAPTMAFRASSGMMQFLDSFAGKEFSGKLAAAFDTQIQSRFSGSGAKGIESKLEKLGFEIIKPPLITHVEGKTDESKLKEGELEKAKSWAQEVVEALSK